MSSESNANVLRHLLPHVNAHPDSPALCWVSPKEPIEEGLWNQALPHESISWAELMARVECASRGLVDRGFKKGDRALLFVPMSVDLYVAMFAVFRLGGIAVFLDAFARQTQLAACANLAQPNAFFGSPEAHFLRAFLPDVLGNIPIQIVAGGESQGAETMQILENGEGPIPPVADVTDSDTALVSFTTGSSGKPKGANRTHGFLTAQHKALSAELPFSPEESDMPAFPIFLLHNIACGLTTVIPAVNFSQPAPTDAHRVLRQLLHTNIDTASMSPALLESLAKLTLQSGLSLPIRRLFTGGAPVGPDLIRLAQKAAPKAEILVFYGSTEAEPIAHIEGHQMLAWLDNEPGFADMEGVCVGLLSDQVEMVLLPMNKSPIALSSDQRVSDLAVEPGQVGEVVVAGDHVCVGYYKNDAAFTENKIQEGQRIWHRTGDLGRMDSEGRLWLVGRVHNAIHRGQDILFPVRPEQLLRQVDAIKNGAYVGMPDDSLGEAAWLAYSTHTEDTLDPSSLKSIFDASGIPVDRFVQVKSIPMDPRHNSKVDYKALREALSKE